MNKTTWVINILFTALIIFTFSFDLTYYSTCNDFKINKEIKTQQLTKLSLVEGLKETICIYEPIKEETKHAKEDIKIPTDYELFYQGSINVYFFLLKFFTFLATINAYLFIFIEDASFNIKEIIKEKKRLYYITSITMSALIIALFIIITIGV